MNFLFHLRYNKKDKSKELAVIQQGIRLPQPEMASREPLPAAAAKPASLPTVNFPALFTHKLPDNTAGKANVRGKSAPPSALTDSTVPTPAVPILPYNPVFIMPTVEGRAAIVTQQVQPQVQPQAQQSRSQYYYNKRKQEKEQSGVKSRKYTRSTNPIVCGKCGQPRDPTLHKQYFGNWYCKTTEKVSFEAWRDNLKSKGYGKKKTDK